MRGITIIKSNYGKFHNLINSYLKHCLQLKLQDDLYPICDIVFDAHLCGLDIYYAEEGFNPDDPQEEYVLTHLHNSDLIFVILDYKNFKEELQEKYSQKVELLKLRNEITKE